MTTAEEARDEALDRVSENAGEDFRDQVHALVAELPSGMEVTGEDIRHLCEDRGIEPHHHNAWGATIRGLVGEYIEATGEYTNAVDPPSHASKIAVYEVI